MRQLQLFTTTELARMRDRTASRNHSPSRDQFRREHEHHRAWGLKRRHAERLRHARNHPRHPPTTHPTAPPQTSAASHQTQPHPLDPRQAEPAQTNQPRPAPVPRHCTVGDDHQPSRGRTADRTGISRTSSTGRETSLTTRTNPRPAPDRKSWQRMRDAAIGALRNARVTNIAAAKLPPPPGNEWASGRGCRDGKGSIGNAWYQSACIARSHQTAERRPDVGRNLLRDSKPRLRVLLDSLGITYQHVNHFSCVTDACHVVIQRKGQGSAEHLHLRPDLLARCVGAALLVGAGHQYKRLCLDAIAYQQVPRKGDVLRGILRGWFYEDRFGWNTLLRCIFSIVDRLALRKTLHCGLRVCTSKNDAREDASVKQTYRDDRNTEIVTAEPHPDVTRM